MGEWIDLNLNDLVAGPAPLHLVVALYITDDGLIAGTGVPPGVSVYDVETLGHVFVLVPCGEGCEEDDAESRAAESVVREEWLGTTATNTAAKQEYEEHQPVSVSFSHIDVPGKQRGADKLFGVDCSGFGEVISGWSPAGRLSRRLRRPAA